MDDYEIACSRAIEQHGGHTEDWLTLREVLGSRPNWRFEADEEMGQAMWCYSSVDECRLVVSTERRVRFLVYEHDVDREHHFSDVSALVEWLDANEERYLEPSQLWHQLFDHLADKEAERWAKEDPRE